MSEEKRRKLQNIKSEVDELHPLLSILFEKMPDIRHIEYTHGKDEMGADFVLSKFDDRFGTIDYIGVIAKLGKIVQDFTDIDKQIEECSVPRTYLGGKEKITISEIWVVITEHITKGAQEKIHEKYKLRKIQFIPGTSLITLIDKYAIYYWNDIPLKTSEYLSLIKTKYNEIDRSLSLFNIDDSGFYIDQDIYYNPQEIEYKKQKPHHSLYHKVDIRDEIDREKILLIEGGMGSGKSKLLRKLIDEYTTPDIFSKKKLLPVAISYNDLVNNYKGDHTLLINALIDKWIFRDVDFQYLLLIDAVDEKNQSAEDRISELKNLIDKIEADPRVKAVITCRYLKGYNRVDYFEGRIKRYELRHLTISKMIEFLKKLCSRLSIANKILEDLKKSQLIRELPKTPIAAIILAKLINENSEDLPSNLTELYMKYSELMLGRWDIDKGLQSQKEYQALDNILMDLSKYLIENEINYIPIGDMILIFKRYLNSRNLDIIPEELYKKMVERCEIVAVDLDSNALFFKHRTFAEFFYAKQLHRNNSLIISEKAFDIYWTSIYFFYLGIQKDNPDVLRKLIDLHPENEFRRWLKIVNMSNYYLAAYATPYDIVTEGLSKIFIEAACLFQDIISNKLNPPIKNVTHMGMLYFIQLVVRSNYSYDYFKNAIEDAAIKICDSKEYDDKTKAYAIFFLNVTYIDLKGTDSFDFLLKDYVKSLPIDLSLAVRHESTDMIPRTKLMKKQDRFIKSIREKKDQNRPIRSKIEELYRRPIGQKKIGD
ncbi:MAG: hypothetical protein Q8K00_00805 [Syntrophales bacterium]|nr:hypothetical protein [Syntrophales bacterium]